MQVKMLIEDRIHSASFILLLNLLWLAEVQAESNSACNIKGDLPVINRHFYHHIQGSNYYKEHNITLPEARYFSERLINELVKQLLSSKLGYRNVSNVDTRLPYSPLTTCTTEVKFDYYTYGDLPYLYNTLLPPRRTDSRNPCLPLDTPPQTMIQFQTSRQGFNKDFTDVGYLGISTRYGFYMSASEAKGICNIGCSLATSTSISRSTSAYSLSNLISYRNQTMQAYADHIGCTDSRCLNVTYISPVCSTATSCAVLLVGDTQYPMVDLEKKIEGLGLPLLILHVGDNLTSFTLSLASADVPVMFFSRSHELLTYDKRFVRSKPWNTNCSVTNDEHEFPIAQVRKVIWNRLAKMEPLIPDLLKKIYISEDSISGMIELYTAKYSTNVTDKSITEFINTWMSTNNLTVCQMLPNGVTVKPRLYIGGFFPLWESSVWKEPSLVTAANIAINIINRDPKWLKDYQLELIVNDTRCDSASALNIFTEYMVHDEVWSHMIGGLGPACSDTAPTLADLSKYYNYVIISYAVKAVVMSFDRDRYPYFFRTIPQINDYVHVYVAMFKSLGLNLKNIQVSIMFDESSGEFPVYYFFMEEFRRQDITMAVQAQLPRQQYLTGDSYDYDRYLDKIKASDSKIIIMDVFEEVARKIMCLAYWKEMTLDQGYTWFLPNVYLFDWYEDLDGINCTKTQMQTAVRGYLTLSHSAIDRSSAIAVGGMNGSHFYDVTYAKAVQNESVSQKVQKFRSGEFGTYTYDAVWAFTYAIQALYEENPAYLKYLHTLHATQRYVSKIREAKFQGVSGAISFNDQGDRSGTIEIRQYAELGSDNYYKANKVGSYTNDELMLSMEKLKWGATEQPTTPSPVEWNCEWQSLATFLGLSCSAALLSVVLPTCILVVLIIVIVALMALRRAKEKYKLAAELASKFNYGRGFLNLNEKEIPREHVVLNRKLGEGAFGTVYGGEAYVDDSWIGVAVKTLKPGSNSEERLDFLREADIMKRFDHKNIARLLGVTTRGEPAYAVMEFMLYGDLKTYLLSRRELVGNDTKEAEDISAASLTRMAMDIVEGLHYLHTKEYIHRDIACRNCLVSANRTVKIGDFGMTRRVYDDGSYTFTRRGKLPVRWMAPESFVDGVFTYKTDIWSFGVCLYEIVTFGSIPYQMLTNGEVFERVKSGRTLNLPEECTDELKSLLLACWHKEPARRPNAADIYVTLAENENMIQPLLACPVYAEIDCDTLELDMSPAPLKPSTILKRPFLRQSSSVISVDTGVSTLSRHRNQSEISAYKKSALANRRRSSNSVVDLFSLVHPTLPTPLSLPSPSHSHEPGPSFQFSNDSRNTCEEVPLVGESKVQSTPTNTRYKHLSGSQSTDQQVRTENDYLLTTRSCSEINDSAYNSQTPLVYSTEESVI